MEAEGKEILDFFRNASWLPAVVSAELERLYFEDGRLYFTGVSINSYHASVAADFLRRKLLDNRSTFTFETVMSAPDKVEMFQKAKEAGYRTYLYYISTADPAINVSRVRNRVTVGGHPVPERKIVERYYRSMALLIEAIRRSDRAYIFDNSGDDRVFVAEITGGK